MEAINLLPWRADRRRRNRYQFLWLLLVCSSCCVIAMLITHAYLYQHLQQEKIRLAHLIQPTRAQSAFVDNRVSRTLLVILKKKNSTQQHLQALLGSLPVDCVLTSLSRQKHQWSITGFSRTTRDVELFIQALTQSHHFQSIILADVNKSQHIQFRINCTDAKP